MLAKKWQRNKSASTQFVVVSFVRRSQAILRLTAFLNICNIRKRFAGDSASGFKRKRKVRKKFVSIRNKNSAFIPKAACLSCLIVTFSTNL